MTRFNRVLVSIRLLLLLSLGGLLSGCVVIPMGSTGPMDDMGTETLTGKTTQEIHDLLGETKENIEMEDVTYLLYEDMGISESLFLAHPIVMIGAIGGYPCTPSAPSGPNSLIV